MSTAAITPAASQLSGEVRHLVEKSISPNTERVYSQALRRLDDRLAGRALTDETLAEYLAELHATGRSPAACSQVVAAVKFRVKLQGIPQGGASVAGPLTDRALAGLRREGRGRGRGQAKGVSWSQADSAAILAENGGRSLAGLRDAAMVAVGSDALLRVSEIAAIRVEDLSKEEDDSGRLLIHCSKTDQEGVGAVQYLGPPTMQRLRAWLEAAGITEGPVFRRVRRGGHAVAEPRPLSPASISAIVRRRAQAAGIEGRVSGHSLRVGGAQSLAAGGASIVEMQTAGRWSSPSMPGHYARGQLAARGAVARLRYGSDQ